MTTPSITERVALPPPGRRARRSRPWLLLGAIFLGIDLLVAGGVLGGLGIRFDAGTAFAANAADNPVLLLGSTFDQSACRTVPLAIGAGDSVFCDHWSATTTVDGKAEVVSLYAAGNDVVDEFTGPMPQSLHWGQTIEQVMATLGDPRRITAAYRTPTLVYMYSNQPYGSLELRFDTNDHLVRINACLTH